MDWHALNDAQWERVAPLPPGKAGALRVHQHGTGARGTQRQAMGRSLTQTRT